MDDCVFCAIAAGREPATFLLRDGAVSVFLDARPITPGHLLVIPDDHCPSLADVPRDLGAHMFHVATRMASALRTSGLPCEGVDLLLADGAAAGQEVPHVHLHVIPRVPGDGFAMHATAWAEPPPERAALEVSAAAIRAALSGSRD